jgi:hypothetical protein
MDGFAQPQNRSDTIGPRFDHLALTPAAAAICYPFFLRAFHALVGTQAATPSPLAIFAATLILTVAFVLPFVALALACQPDADPGRGGSPMSAWRPQLSMSFLVSFRPCFTAIFHAS